MGSKPGLSPGTASWFRRGTPQELVDMLQKVTAEAINDATVRSRLAMKLRRPPEIRRRNSGAFIKAEHTRWADIVKTANLALN